MESISTKQPRVYRRGEVLFKAGEPVTQILVIQSGLASVQLFRGKSTPTLEVAQVGAGQLLGEEALWGRKTWSVTAVANNEVRAFSIPLADAFAMLSSGPPLVKVFLKGMIEKERLWWQTLMEIHTESDPTPCPPSRVTQLFAVIHQAASYTGTVKKDATVVVWPSFKKYCQRTFLESPVRLEQAVYILVKLGAAKLEMIPCETDPEAPDELGFVHFTDLEVVRGFYEFHRAYYGRRTPPGADGSPPTAVAAYLAILREIEIWNELGKVVNPISEPGEAA